jgi:hypothetical protein
MSSRSVDDLTPAARDACLEWQKRCLAIGILVHVVCTLRTYLEQVAYYAQHREPLGAVNVKRAAAGMGPITEAQNANYATHTMHSRHFPGPDGKARAWDYAIEDPVTHKWFDPKVDGNKDGINDWKQAEQIAHELGLYTLAFEQGHIQIDHP